MSEPIVNANDLVAFPPTVGSAPGIILLAIPAGKLLDPLTMHAVSHLGLWAQGIYYPDASSAEVIAADLSVSSKPPLTKEQACEELLKLQNITCDNAALFAVTCPTDGECEKMRALTEAVDVSGILAFLLPYLLKYLDKLLTK